jgi:membrane-associated protease RseP (regulator of RpoE activity)
MKRFLKILHEIGTVGTMGAIAAVLILLVSARGSSAEQYAVVRLGIDHLARWLLLPSLGLVLFTGLVTMAVHRSFHNAGWAWIKALLGVSVLEGTLGGIIGTARDAAAVSSRVAAGTADSGLLAPILRQEWGALWVILFLSLVNIVLAVWRPRKRPSAPTSSREAAEQKAAA